MKAVIFDFDGVIHNTLNLAYGINKEMFGNNLSLEKYKDIFNGNIYKHEAITEEASNKFFELQKKEFDNLRIEESIKKELLKLKDKYMLFIISSNEEDTLNIYLKNNNILNIFDRVLGVETHKSKIEKFKILFEEYNFDKGNCIFVTDTLGDILEANKLGVNTIAVDFGFHERSRLEKGFPKKIISNFDEIFSYVENLN